MEQRGVVLQLTPDGYGAALVLIQGARAFCTVVAKLQERTDAIEPEEVKKLMGFAQGIEEALAVLKSIIPEDMGGDFKMETITHNDISPEEQVH